MKQTLSLFILTLFFLSCNGQKKYFEPTGIIDKTEEYAQSNIGWIELNDKESVDGYTKIGNSIFGGEIACNVKPLKKIDVKSFKVLAGTRFAKDTNHVYYPLEITCIDYEDCGVCYYDKIIVERASPKTFKYIDKDYATDGNRVYFRGVLIPNADGMTFRVINGPEYFYFAVDKNNVYKHNQILENADPLTFYYDKNDKRNIDTEYQHKFIIGDEKNVWEFIPPNTINKIETK